MHRFTNMIHFLKKKKMYLFIFGCAASWLLHSLSLVAVCELLIVVASPFGEPRP